MMKKLLSTIMAMLLLWSFAVSAHAENEFVLRNGIQFGDTKEQVRAKETIAINEERSEDEEDLGHLWTEKGNVAGFEDVIILYTFDEKDKLIEVKWGLPTRSNSDSSDNDYSKLKKAMSEKYGTPLGYTNGDCYIITTDTLINAYTLVGINKMFEIPSDIRDYDEWDYEYQNGQHIKIDLVQFYTTYTNSKKYEFWIGYKHFTDEELNAAKQEKEEKNAAVLNDI